MYSFDWEVGQLTFLNGSLGVNTPELTSFMVLNCPCVSGWQPFQHLKLNQSCYPGGCTIMQNTLFFNFRVVGSRMVSTVPDADWSKVQPRLQADVVLNQGRGCVSTAASYKV